MTSVQTAASGPNDGADADGHDVEQARRAGVTTFAGTTIEWFDFYIYGTASALVLGKLFFPDASPAVGTLAAFAKFAVGFIARPLGGVIFGHFGDKYGRKKAVIVTLLLMGAGTVGVGLYIRLHISETPEIRKAVAAQDAKRIPIKEVFRDHSKIVFLGIGAMIAGVAITYIKTTFALAWATTDLDFGRNEFLLVITIALVVQVITQPFGAILASRITVRRAVAWMLLPELVLLPLMFVMVHTGPLTLAVLGMALATAPHTMYYSVLAGILSEQFPAQVRYTGTSATYQASTACSQAPRRWCRSFCRLRPTPSGPWSAWDWRTC